MPTWMPSGTGRRGRDERFPRADGRTPPAGVCGVTPRILSWGHDSSNAAVGPAVYGVTMVERSPRLLINTLWDWSQACYESFSAVLDALVHPTGHN